MKLWLLSQNMNTGWDTYDSAVVAAETAEAAKRFDPGGYLIEDDGCCWAGTLEDIEVKFLGEAAPGVKAGVICASFNAG
jgi:hypothetical protein